jgi:hypothetical protein
VACCYRNEPRTAAVQFGLKLRLGHPENMRPETVSFQLVAWCPGRPPWLSEQCAGTYRDFRTHRRPKSEVVHCDNCSTFILEFVMNDVVERILNAYQTMSPLDAERVADSRKKISRYIESLASAGQRDTEQLAI